MPNILELISNLSIILNCITLIGLPLSNNKNGDCKAEIKSKISLIITFNSIIMLLTILHTILKICIANKEGPCLCFGIYSIISKLCNLGLSITNLVICHKYYNLSNNWENCGSLKGWIIYNFIALYFDFVMSIIYYYDNTYFHWSNKIIKFIFIDN